MNTPHSRRWGAVLIAGGLCAGAAYSFYPSTAHSPLIRPAAGLALLGMLLIIPGLVAFASTQAQRAVRGRRLGWAATGLICLGLVLLEFPHLLLGLFDPHRLYDLHSYHASFIAAVGFPGLICIAVGEVLLAVAMARSRVFPGWALGLILLNVVLSAVASSVPAISDAIHVPAPNYLLVGLLGLALLVPNTGRVPVDADLATPAAA